MKTFTLAWTVLMLVWGCRGRPIQKIHGVRVKLRALASNYLSGPNDYGRVFWVGAMLILFSFFDLFLKLLRK